MSFSMYRRGSLSSSSSAAASASSALINVAVVGVEQLGDHCVRISAKDDAATLVDFCEGGVRSVRASTYIFRGSARWWLVMRCDSLDQRDFRSALVRCLGIDGRAGGWCTQSMRHRPRRAAEAALAIPDTTILLTLIWVHGWTPVSAPIWTPVRCLYGHPSVLSRVFAWTPVTSNSRVFAWTPVDRV